MAKSLKDIVARIAQEPTDAAAEEAERQKAMKAQQEKKVQEAQERSNSYYTKLGKSPKLIKDLIIDMTKELHAAKVNARSNTGDNSILVGETPALVMAELHYNNKSRHVSIAFAQVASPDESDGYIVALHSVADGQTIWTEYARWSFETFSDDAARDAIEAIATRRETMK